MSDTNQRAWEEWQLTAFVLGELDAEVANEIQTAAADDARLSAEIVAIRKTLDQVTACLRSEPHDDLGADRLQQILAAAHPASTDIG